jgi:glycerol uptake facilitator-like aquaporin
MPACDLRRRLAAEALGTALLVATVVGSGIMAEALTRDVGLTLLANTLATGAILVVLITIFGPISGAHFNPAVSLVFALKRELRAKDAAAYVAAQILGGLLGIIAAHLMFALPLFEASQKARTGGPQWFAEAVAAFGLVTVILTGIHFAHAAVPWLVGLYITAAYWFTASTSFAVGGRNRSCAHEYVCRDSAYRCTGLCHCRNRRCDRGNGPEWLAVAG